MPKETPPTNTKALLCDANVLEQWNKLQRMLRCHRDEKSNDYRSIGARLGMTEGGVLRAEMRALRKIRVNGAAMVVLKKCMTQKTRE